jgi:thiamine pyrophosphate-dependent acetolactate synthase large subunit-like protein
VIVVVFADQRLSLIDVKQQQRGLAGGGVRLGEVCWATLAEGLGAAGFRADTDDQLRRALDAAAAHDGPSLVEARIDPHSYRRTLAAIRG